MSSSDGRDAGAGQLVPVRRVPQPGGAPHLVALGERPRDGKGDLAGRAGDQDLLAVEHPLVIAHSARNVKYLICWPCAADVRRRGRGLPRRVHRDSSTSTCPPRPRRRGAVALDVARAGVGAALAAAAVRPRVAAAGQPAGVRRPQRGHPRAVRAPRGTCAAAHLPRLQPAGRRDHRGVAAVIRHRRAEAAVGGADPARRDDRVAGHERTGRGLRPRRA